MTHRISAKRCVCIVALVLMLQSCVSTDSAEYAPMTGEVIPKSGTQTIEEVIESVDENEQVQEDAAPSEPGAEAIGEEISHDRPAQIPLEINDQVERWIEYFTVKDRERFRRFLERGEKYRPMITAVLKDQGVPTELYYQAMIESGFSVAATSRASAVGIWQFIRGTGRRYGLRVDRYVDERRDPMRATIAAALYLKDLHNVFQSWYLAMAAYNAGERRILGAIMRAKSRDFWELVEKKALPSETMNYIPKFLAATTIGHNPSKYGFDDIAMSIMPRLNSVTVPSPIKLRDLALLTGVSLETLQEYNPHILRGVTPHDVKTYRLWLPKEQIAMVEAQRDQLASLRTKAQSYARNIAGGHGIHVVRRGESLYRIARKYGTSVANLKRLNNMRSTRIYVGTRLKVSGTARHDKRYRVRRGDNLTIIAQKHGTSVNQLKRINNLRRNTIYPGQLLKISGTPDRYRVKHGDNLTTIARKFGISVRDLKRLNRLRRNTIYAGQILKVEGHRL